jgi:phage terminase small subunit
VGRTRDELTDRQRRFVDEYLIDRNATRAAKAAGYSEKGADVRGSELLGNRRVKAAIDEAAKAQTARCQFTADDVLLQLKRTVMFDIGQAFDEQGRLLPIHMMPPDLRMVLNGFKVKTEYSHERDEPMVPVGLEHEFKLPDRNVAISNAMKHFGMFKPDKVEHEAGESLRELLERSMELDEKDE